MSTAASPTWPDGQPSERSDPGRHGPRVAPASEPTRDEASSARDERPEYSEPGSVRASNAEREETVAALHAALGEGRLDLEETDTRVAQAYAARYRADLPPLLADLPGGAGRSWPLTGAPSWPELWRSLVWRLRILLFGDEASAPTARDGRWTAVALGVGAAWALLCAVIAAALVVA